MTSDLVMYLDPERDGFYIKIRHFASGTRKTCYFFHHLYKKIVFFCSHLNMFLKEKNCNLQLLTRRAFYVNHIFFLIFGEGIQK